MVPPGQNKSKYQMPNIQMLKLHNDISHNDGRHSRESGNPEKHWIPGQARNDKLDKTYITMYNSFKFEIWILFEI
jgi:hypothetical protein